MPSDFAKYDSNIFVMSTTPPKMIKYSYGGDLIHEGRLSRNFQNFNIINDSIIAFHHDYNLDQTKSKLQIHKYTKNSYAKKIYYTSNLNNGIRSLASLNKNIHEHNNKIYYWSPYNDSIKIFNTLTGRNEPGFCFDFGEITAPRDLIEIAGASDEDYEKHFTKLLYGGHPCIDNFMKLNDSINVLSIFEGFKQSYLGLYIDFNDSIDLYNSIVLDNISDQLKIQFVVKNGINLITGNDEKIYFYWTIDDLHNSLIEIKNEFGEYEFNKILNKNRSLSPILKNHEEYAEDILIFVMKIN